VRGEREKTRIFDKGPEIRKECSEEERRLNNECQSKMKVFQDSYAKSVRDSLKISSLVSTNGL